jgi:hypothetical protein
MKHLKFFCRIGLSAALFLIASSANSAVCNNWSTNSGTVTRVYPTFAFQNKPAGTYFRIAGTTSGLQDSVNGYYFIPQKANYSEMHNLILEAVRSGRQISVNTVNCAPANIAEVLYLVLDL